MPTREQKFRNLYYVINADDVNELSNYFNEFPDEDPCDNKLTIGKKYGLFSHALDVNSPKCLKFIIGMLNLEQMSWYIRAISKSYKHNPDVLECYIAKLKILTEQSGKTGTISNLILTIIREKHVVPKELVKDLIDIPHYDFENKLKYNTNNTRKNLESIMPECKNSWITFFIEYYISKNIDFKQLAIKLLLYNNCSNAGTYWKIIKKYWDIHDNSKFKIEFLEKDGESEHEYTLEFIVFITGDIKVIESIDFAMFKDNTFEEQFNNYISEKKPFHERTGNLISSVARVVYKESYYCSEIFSKYQIQILRTVLKGLSNEFFLKLKEIYDTQIKICKDNGSYSYVTELTKELKSIDELHKEFIELAN